MNKNEVIDMLKRCVEKSAERQWFNRNKIYDTCYINVDLFLSALEAERRSCACDDCVISRVDEKLFG